MTMHTRNQLKIPYKDYQLLHQIPRLVKQIPASRRQALAQDIQALAAITGCKDPEILEAVVAELNNLKGTMAIDGRR